MLKLKKTKITSPLSLSQQNEILKLPTLKIHLRIDDTFQDELIKDLFWGALADAEAYCHRTLAEVTKTGFSTGYESVEIVGRPSEVVEILYKDISGVFVILNLSLWTLKEINDSFILIFCPTDTLVLPNLHDSDENIKVVYKEGYKSDEFPKNIWTALALKTRNLIDNPADRSERFPQASEKLLNAFRDFV
jgi:hypothetical protein